MFKPLFVPWLLAATIGCVALCAIGQTTAASSSLDGIIAQLKSQDATERMKAVQAIGKIGPAAKPAVPALVELLNGGSPTDRLGAAGALAKIGREAEAALPALRSAQAGGDQNLRLAAQAAAESIDPPVATVVWDSMRNPYILGSMLATGAGIVALLFLGVRRGDKIPEAKWKVDQEKAAARVAGAKSSSDPKTPPGSAPIKAAAAPAPPPPAPKPATDRLNGVPRSRVSKPLQGFEQYVADTSETPESIKRDLMRAQDELKRLGAKQHETTELLARDEVKRDTEKANSLRKNLDDFGSERYKLEVRAKALEIKMIEALLGDGKTSDPELRERTEARLKGMWDALRALLETPSKIVYRSGQFVTIPIGTTTPVADVRLKLFEFGIVMLERPTTGPLPTPVAAPSTPAAPEPLASGPTASPADARAATEEAALAEEPERPATESADVVEGGGPTETTEGAVVLEKDETPSTTEGAIVVDDEPPSTTEGAIVIDEPIAVAHAIPVADGDEKAVD